MCCNTSGTNYYDVYFCNTGQTEDKLCCYCSSCVSVASELRIKSAAQLWVKAIIFVVSIQLFLMPSETLDSAQRGVSVHHRPSFSRGLKLDLRAATFTVGSMTTTSFLSVHFRFWSFKKWLRCCGLCRCYFTSNSSGSQFVVFIVCHSVVTDDLFTYMIRLVD